MHLHIDGDLLVYRCGFAAEKGEYEIQLPDGDQEVFTYKKDLDKWLEQRGLDAKYVSVKFTRTAEPVANALHNVKTIIESIVDRCEGSELTVYLSGVDNFRDSVATLKTYKGNRDPAHKPVHGQSIKDYIVAKYTTVFSEAEEADDTLAWNHMLMYNEDPLSSVVVTTDKDLDMIPGLHYNFLRDEAYTVNETDALYAFYRQMLMGDPTDNIPGIPGIGEKRAEALLENVERTTAALGAKVKQTYKDAYKANWRAAMLEMGQLLWIRRRKDEMWMIPQEIDE